MNYQQILQSQNNTGSVVIEIGYDENEVIQEARITSTGSGAKSGCGTSECDIEIAYDLGDNKTIDLSSYGYSLADLETLRVWIH